LRVDRRLNIPCGAIDVAIKLKLQDDAARAGRARGRHFRYTRDMPKGALKRGRHRRAHDFGAGSRQQACTEMVGKSTWGKGATGNWKKAIRPARVTARVSSVVAPDGR